MDAFVPPIKSDFDNSNQLFNSLDTLAQVIHILDIPDASYQNYSMAISNMITREMALSRSLDRLKAIEEELRDHLASLTHEHDLISHWNQNLTPGHPASIYPETAETLDRRKEALVRKAKEYHKELEALLADNMQVPVTITQFMAQKEKNQAKQRELKEKRAKIKTFQGLPPNLNLARHELRAARQRQTELIRLRERLLGRMAESVG